jgi:hypothetical protein
MKKQKWRWLAQRGADANPLLLTPIVEDPRGPGMKNDLDSGFRRNDIPYAKETRIADMKYEI